MVDCSHISGSVCIAAVNLSQLQILREFNDIDNNSGRNSLRSQKRRISGHDLDKVHWNCVSCDSSESPWLCLACGLIFCGRYVNGHGIKHYQEMNHPRHCLSMQCYTYEVFWWVWFYTVLFEDEFYTWLTFILAYYGADFYYACDDYVGGDTDDGKIYSVRHSLAYFHKARCEDHNYSSQLYISAEDIYDSEDPVDLGTEEEDEVITQAVAERIIQLDEDSGSVPEDDGKPVNTVPDFRPLHAIPDIDTNRSGPLIGGRSLRPRKRKQSFTLSISRSPSPKQLRGTEDTKYRGLKNIGNTCFMNSVIQALNSADVFREYLVRLPILEPDDIIDEHQPLASPRYNTRRAASSVCITSTMQPQSSPTVLAEELRKVLQQLSRTSYFQAVSPEDFFQAVWKISPRFRGFHQQDAHEFLRCMMDRLHAELRRCRIPESVDQWLAATCGGGNIPNGSAVTTMFEGSLQSQVVCLTCHTASNKHDPFMDLSLDIFVPAANGRASNLRLADCINRFFAKEELDQCEQYMCGNCKDKRPSTKQLFLRVLPNVLCLHLKRFRWSHVSRGKLDNMVDFPVSGLDITPYMASSVSRNANDHPEDVTFDLSSVVVHHGSGVSSGHYTTYGQRNGNWYHFNDSSVKACTEQTVMKQKAYLLFYTRSIHRA